jgi:hypothetical protein
MAQTTRLASFGPVFIVAAFHLLLCRIFRRLHHPIYTIKDLLVSKKYEQNKRETYLDERKQSDKLDKRGILHHRIGASRPVEVNTVNTVNTCEFFCRARLIIERVL